MPPHHKEKKLNCLQQSGKPPPAPPPPPPPPSPVHVSPKNPSLPAYHRPAPPTSYPAPHLATITLDPPRSTSSRPTPPRPAPLVPRGPVSYPDRARLLELVTRTYYTPPSTTPLMPISPPPPSVSDPFPRPPARPGPGLSQVLSS
ncbi:hypothetical protein E2C01_063186 [Portunus trituberculatus]|uniref:Uncharacterized protein n=1 Tax=Portunus trituberculatus TaxID=210409 RepID=A0A5B7HFN9_PORTR|nr:hypothetical protein [Portunus trituberculatus]